jgi:signal transduction histidine kinase/ligand-binding sensor domain-containing protein
MLKGMRSFLLIGLFLCCWVKPLFSQEFPYSLLNYSAAEGLPQSQVTNILEDQEGYLWMGTQGGGLTRFDGREFKVYTVQDSLLANEVLDIHFDNKHRLWALHLHGVSRFDGLHFKTYQIPDSLSASRFIKIYEINDTIFLLSEAGLRSKIYNEKVIYWEKPYLNKRRIRQVFVTQDGRALHQLGNGKIYFQTKDRTDSITPIGTSMYYNFFTWKNQVLARSENGIFKLETPQNHFSKLSWNTKGYVISYDEARNIFWTTDGNHLFKESVDVPVKCDTILHDVRVMSVFFDSEGNTWMGSDGYGLYRYFTMDFHKVTPPNIRGVMSFLADRNSNTWIGTMGKGLWRIKEGKVKSYFDNALPSRNNVNSIKQLDDGSIWLGTRFGIGKYDPTHDSFNWLTMKEGLPSNFVFIIEPDDHGGFWIGTGRGVCYYDGKKLKTLTEKEGIKEDMACWTLHYSTKYQTLFIGTDVDLIAVHKNSARSIPVIKRKNAVITSIHQYQDSLLVLSTGGAGTIVVNPKTLTHQFITSHEGLASDFNYFVGEDEKGFLWIGSEKGINKIKLNKANEIIQNLHYGFDNGLTGVETNQNAFLLTGEKKYFGLVDGLYSFSGQQLPNKKSFDLHLTDVEILYGEFPSRIYADSLFGIFKVPYNPVLPPDKNHVTFHFNRVDKRYPNSIKYKYILENFDKTWALPSSMQQVTYGNLPPGDYVFRVKATNSSGSWAANEIAYPFTVRSPFYMRASFIVGLFILLAGLITLILYLRVKQRIRKAVLFERIRTQEQEILRKEIARDFHDEMGNQLTRIINYVSLLKLNNSNGHNNHSELYGKVEESAKYLYNGTRDFIWAIDPVNDELNKLFIHIRDFGEKLFEEKNISFRAFNVISDTKDKVKLPYGFSREANLIFKEAMTNAFKYSQAKNVTFSLHQYEDHYEMILEDDGIGFYTGHIEKSNGLKNIRERADRIKAILRISSSKDQGTKITLHFKLAKKIKYGLTI